MNDRSHRDSILLEEAEILEHQTFPGDQYLLRVQTPGCAAKARPGQFVHLQVHPLRPLRRPISIMRASPKEGWMDLLYKVVGEGTALLAQRRAGEFIDLMAPIGRPFKVKERRPLLLSLIHISEPRDDTGSRMPSSA